MVVNNHAWTERLATQKLKLIQSHWDQTKPRLDQVRVSLEIGKKQEDGLQAPSRSERFWEVTLSNKRGECPNRLAENGLPTSIDPRTKGQN